MDSTIVEKLKNELKIACEKCFGLCCVALYFSASEGFPTDKEAGKPCINLQSDFTCTVHKELRNRGLKGCISYDCFGAGQKVSQVTFSGHSWLDNKDSSKQMFESFLIMRQLHEMLWYLTQAFIWQTDNNTKAEISSLMEDTEHLTVLDAESLQSLDILAHRNKVNRLLKNTSVLVRTKVTGGEKPVSTKKQSKSNRVDYFGSDMRGKDLRGADLRGACLIAANLREVDLSGADLIGADLRDADLSGANLSKSIFLTQAQLNTAKGDLRTQLPILLARPSHW